MVVQRSVVVMLLMIAFIGCGEDEPEKVKPNEVIEVERIIDESPTQEIIWEKDGTEMVLIPAGSFEMGDHFNEGLAREHPIHIVELDAFYMDKHEVTVRKFREFVRETGYGYDRWDDVAESSPTSRHPMIFVNWHDATAYCEWAGKRLPTEAEWEYVARGGLSGKRYLWGDNEDQARSYANYNGTNGKDKWTRCAPVDSFKSNRYGLSDMAGNVYEWCADWYDEDYYNNSALRNPQGPSSGEDRVLRGGSWPNVSNLLRVACRFNFNPMGANFNCGFRCVSGSPAVQQ